MDCKLFVTLAVVALALVATTSASRISHMDDVDLAMAGDDVFSGNNALGRLMSLVTGGDLQNKRSREAARMAIKLYVPPSVADDFIDAWRDLEEDVIKERGNRKYDLKKTMADNLVFYIYGEWDSKSDFVDHLRSDHVADFLDFIQDNKIVWNLVPLNRVHAAKERKEDENRRHRDEQMAHVMVKYFVPPGEQQEFEKVWIDTADRVEEKEEGNRIFALAKSETDNVLYYGYGTWDDMESFRDHIESKHFDKLQGHLADRDIVYRLSLLRKLGSQAE